MTYRIAGFLVTGLALVGVSYLYQYLKKKGFFEAVRPTDERPGPAGWTMRELDELFEALERSEFRSRFRLRGREAAYLREKGLEAVLEHARDFVEKRLAPARARQRRPADAHAKSPGLHRPARHGHLLSRLPGEMAQIPKGRALSDREVQYVVAVIERWLVRQRGGLTGSLAGSGRRVASEKSCAQRSLRVSLY